MQSIVVTLRVFLWIYFKCNNILPNQKICWEELTNLFSKQVELTFSYLVTCSSQYFDYCLHISTLHFGPSPATYHPLYLNIRSNLGPLPFQNFDANVSILKIQAQYLGNFWLPSPICALVYLDLVNQSLIASTLFYP